MSYGIWGISYDKTVIHCMYEWVSVIEMLPSGKCFEPSCILECPCKSWQAKEVNISYPVGI